MGSILSADDLLPTPCATEKLRVRVALTLNVIMQYVRSTIKFYISKFTPSFSIAPRKFTKILQLDQLMYGTVDKAKRPLTSSAPSTCQASGTATITGNK